MSLPPLAEIPPASIRLSISPVEWEACLESWLTLSQLYLRLPPKEFSAVSTPEDSLVKYLQTFYHDKARLQPSDASLSSTNALKLQRTNFLLVHRLINGPNPIQRLLEFGFLADFCHIHARNASLTNLMREAWRLHPEALRLSVEKRRRSILILLSHPIEGGAQKDLRQVADVMCASADVASLLMTGSDLLDVLVQHYDRLRINDERKLVVTTAYYGLISLVKVDAPNLSLLSDYLYSLKAQADSNNGKTTLLADLVTNTPFIAKVKRSIDGNANAGDRLPRLLDSLETYRTPSIAQPRKHNRQKPDKGKSKAMYMNGDMHMHRMSLVTQVRDLFPDLGSGFVLKLLDEYNDDVEQVTSHLLDDSLPSHLREADRNEQSPAFTNNHAMDVGHLEPRSTPPPPETYVPQRRNVFDDDELDRLEVDTARLHMGKKKDVSSSGQPNKAAILSALAAFDSDDDERDDTYDVEDVGGTVDTAHPDGEPGPSAKVTQEENDMALFTAYRSSPELFGRTFDVRRGQARQALKAETGMTDEAIEGWAIMLQRDPRRLRNIEARFSDFDGRQAELGRTAYRDSPGGTETEDSDVPSGRSGFRGRGRGRGGRGRGGGVAGPSSDPNTAAAQRRKEASKSSRANHNRRDQRAKKMARGGFAG